MAFVKTMLAINCMRTLQRTDFPKKKVVLPDDVQKMAAQSKPDQLIYVANLPDTYYQQSFY